MSAKTIDISRSSNGGIIATVNGVPRTLGNPKNILCKELNDTTGPIGIVVKSADGQFRVTVFPADTFTINGVAAPAPFADQILMINDTIISGSGTYVAPAKLAQTITFAAPAGRAHTAPAFTLDGTASSGLPVSYASSDNAVFTISGTTLTPVGAGTANITASQAGNANYAAATNVVRALILS